MEDLIHKWKSQKDSKQKRHKKFINKLYKHKGKRLDHFANELHEQTFGKIDCLKCANCCNSIPPIITHTDSKRIAQYLGMKISEFEEKHITIDEDGDKVFNQSPCYFLNADNTCQVYEVRPKACREYPHTDNSNFSANLKIHLPNSKYCPAVFNIIEEMIKNVPI